MSKKLGAVSALVGAGVLLSGMQAHAAQSVPTGGGYSVYCASNITLRSNGTLSTCTLGSNQTVRTGQGQWLTLASGTPVAVTDTGDLIHGTLAGDQYVTSGSDSRYCASGFGVSLWYGGALLSCTLRGTQTFYAAGLPFPCRSGFPVYVSSSGVLNNVCVI